jgi:predicted nuclease of predicted toxin-antitoxin system
LKNPYKKWRDEYVIFLDDAFDCDIARDMLVDAGFSVERFATHFATETGTREQGVKDPQVIQLCNTRHFILLTTDGDILKRHRRHIEKCAHLGILATAHNKVDDISVWVRAFIALKPTIEKNNFRKRTRPWFGRFDKNGRMSTPVKTVEPSPAPQTKEQAR